jgi:hypothetical protein
MLPFLVSAGEPPELSHNPFSRPHLDELLDTNATSGDRDGSGLAVDLKATMVSGRHQLANIAGRILRPGDELGGYRLEEVYEDRARFSRDGKILTVFVKPRQATKDD